MPQVPRYGGAKVQESATPNVRFDASAPLEAFGGGSTQKAIAEGIQSVGKGLGDVGKYYEAEKKRADTLAVDEAESKTIALKQDMFWNPETGAMNRRGKDAFGVFKDYGERFDKETRDIEDSLADDGQKALYRAKRQAHQNDLNLQLQKHVGSESLKFDNATSQALIANHQNEAVFHYNNPEAVAKSIAEQRRVMQEYGERNGLGSPEIESLASKNISATHRSVIERMNANDQDGMARGYFSQIKGQVTDGDDIKAIERILKDGTERGSILAWSDKIEGEASDVTAALAMAKDAPPEIRVPLESRLSSRFSQKRQEVEAYREQKGLGIAEIVDKSPGFDPIELSKQEGWSSLLPDQRKALTALANQRMRPNVDHTDSKAYNKYFMMSPTSMAKVTDFEMMVEARTKLAPEDYAVISSRWAKSREAVRNPDKDRETKSVFNDEEMIFNAMKAGKVAGLDKDSKPGKLSSKESEAYQNFRSKVDTAWQAAYKDGKAPGPVEKQKIIMDVLKPTVFVKDGWFSSDKEVPTAALTGEQSEDLVIPDSSRSEMTRYIGSVGKKVTQDKLQRMRAARVQGNRTLYRQIAEE